MWKNAFLEKLVETLTYTHTVLRIILLTSSLWYTDRCYTEKQIGERHPRTPHTCTRTLDRNREKKKGLMEGEKRVRVEFVKSGICLATLSSPSPSTAHRSASPLQTCSQNGGSCDSWEPPASGYLWGRNRRMYTCSHNKSKWVFTSLVD